MHTLIGINQKRAEACTEEAMHRRHTLRGVQRRGRRRYNKRIEACKEGVHDT
jgi:hypothetical protein